LVLAVEDGGIFVARSANCGKHSIRFEADEIGDINLCRRLRRLKSSRHLFPQLALWATNMSADFIGYNQNVNKT
jgi:hypothetical protein